MKTLYQYCLVRFLPFADSGEFVNIGLVLCAPAAGTFAFQLVPEQSMRVPQFFPQLHEALFPVTIRALSEELHQIQQLAEQQTAPELFAAFQNLIQEREQLVRYSALRSVLSTAKIDELLAQLAQQLVY